MEPVLLFFLAVVLVLAQPKPPTSSAANTITLLLSETNLAVALLLVPTLAPTLALTLALKLLVPTLALTPLVLLQAAPAQLAVLLLDKMEVELTPSLPLLPLYLQLFWLSPLCRLYTRDP